MGFSTRATFDQQLANLVNQLLRMGSLVEEALDLAIRALVERDSALALRVIRNDQDINALRYAIEEKCYLLLATQQPMASDLRRIAAAISLATNMERMADHAAGIAILARRLNNEPELAPLVHIQSMAEVGREMLRQALDSYVSVNADQAREVAERDDRLNQLNEVVLRELLTYMVEQPNTIRRGTYLIWVAHNLERWGDRVKNICERVVYISTGQLADFDTHSGTDEGLDEHDVVAAVLDEQTEE